MWSERRIAVTVLTGVMLLCPVYAAQDVCYTAGGVAGIVIATVIVTLILTGLTAAIVRYIWNHRTVPYKGGEKVTMPETCLPEKQLIGPKTDYAFDNPYFKDDDGGATPDAAEKGEAGLASGRGDNDSSQNSKINSGSKQKKTKPFTNIPFYSVFGQGYKKTKSMDDSYISKQFERISVPLRGHDFTGLGFNICGNMRDGIFVKDVLHRGPASESGKIKAGDRIISVTVSFGSIVYEDALTILSYASPYDVRLEIEEGGEKNVLLATSSPGKRLASASFRNGGQRLFHPLYRSQSIDDLTQIGKESFLLHTKSSGSSASYKRSQSTQAAALKLKPHLKLSESAPDTKALCNSKRSTKSTTSSESSLSKKISTETLESSSCEDIADGKDVPDDDKIDRMKLSSVPLGSGKTDDHCSSQAVVTKPAELEPSVREDVQEQEISDIFEEPKYTKETVSLQQQTFEYFGFKIPKVPPRKQNTPGKRKAPSPPKAQQPNFIATEISAVIHQVDEVVESPQNFHSTAQSHIEDAIHPNVGELHRSETYDIQHKNFEKPENSRSTSGSSLYSSEEVSESPSPKRKASSLGDLTKLNENGNVNVSASILERAVSLDLKQPGVPESNLDRQKKILKPPAFNPEDTSEEDFQNIRDQEIAVKDWELSDPWRKLPLSQVDNTESDKMSEITMSATSEKVPMFSPVMKSLDSSGSITNGHHPTSPEIRGKLDGVSIASLKTKKDVSSPSFSLSTSISSTNTESGYKNITSTPAHKAVEFSSFLEANSPVESFAGEKEQESYIEGKAKHDSARNESSIPETMSSSSFSRGSHSLSIPVSLSIPIIPPVIHNYEKLSISPSSNVQEQKDSPDNKHQDSEETHTPSLYKPFSLTKQLKSTNAILTMSLSPDVEPVIKKHTDEAQESWSNKEKSLLPTPSESVNGDEVDFSSIGQYKTAIEFPTLSDNTLFVTSKLRNTPLPSGSLPKTDAANKSSSSEAPETSMILGKDFSFAKKDIVLTLGEEDLPILSRGSDSPPPQLEPPQ